MVSGQVNRLLTRLWSLIVRFPRGILMAGALLAAFSTVIAVLFLQLDSDQDNLVSPRVPYQRRYLEALKNFGDQEYLYVVVEVPDVPDGTIHAEAFAASLAARLRTHPEHVEALYYRITADDLGAGLLYYSSLDEAAELSSLVAALGPELSAWLQRGSLVELVERSAALLDGGDNDVGLDARMLGPALAALEDFSRRMDDALKGEPQAEQLFDVREGFQHYFYAGEQQLLIMRILPVKDYGTVDVIAAPLAAIRQELAATRAEFPRIRAGLTGRPVLSADEMTTTNRDMTRASLIAIALVGTLFMIVMHGWVRPVLVVLAQLLAIAWTFGFTTLSVGVLNLLSIVFVLVLIGIGKDFGVYLVMRYVECRQEGMDIKESVRIALSRTGPGVILGAVTSVCAFYSVLGSDFSGLAQLGLIGGTGILLSLAAMLVILPALLLLVERRDQVPARMVRLPFIGRWTAHPKRLLTVLTIFTLVLLPGLMRVRFSYNLLELQARGLESVTYEKLLVDTADESTWYAIAVADDLAEARDLQRRFAALPTVGHMESLTDYLPQDQERKAELFAAAAASIGPETGPTSWVEDVDGAVLAPALRRLAAALEQLAERLFAAGAGEDVARLDRVLVRIEKASKQLNEDPARAQRLAGLQAQLQREAADTQSLLRRWLTAAPVTVETLPESVRIQFVGRDGRLQVKVVPRGDIWQFEQLERFIAELRQVDPQITGVPISVYESAQLMRRTFLKAALLTLLLVSLLLYGFSRAFHYVAMALLPLAINMVWLLSIMGWIGLSFNLANFFAIPMLIAISVDGGVNLQHRWKDISSGDLFATSTPMAVAVSFATTMIGFGGLLLAHHRGLASLGGVMVLGSLTGMFSYLLVLPALLSWFSGRKRNRPRKGSD
jgi:hypothetical protein